MLTAMLEALAGQLVFPAKKGTSDATGHDMVVTGLVLGNQMAARISHAGILASRLQLVHRRLAHQAVGNLLVQCLSRISRVSRLDLSTQSHSESYRINDGVH